MWKKGRNPIILSPCPSGPPLQLSVANSVAFNCCELLTIFMWVKMTPFGSPVVPDEYTKNAVSSCGLIFGREYFVTPEVSLMLVKCFNLDLRSDISPIRMILSSTNPTIFAAFSATGKHDSYVTNTFAPASLSWKANSSAV